MKTPDLFDLMTNDPAPANGQQLAEEGAALALEHTERVTPGWGESAFAMLIEYARTIGREFTSVDVRKWAYAQGLELPEDERSWGGVFSRAKKAKKLNDLRYEPLAAAECHRRPGRVWEWIG